MLRDIPEHHSIMTQIMVALLLGSFCFLFPLGTKKYIYLFYVFSLFMLIAKFYAIGWKTALSRAKYEIFPWLPLLFTVVLLTIVHGASGYSIYFQALSLIFLCSIFIDRSFLTQKQIVLFLAFVTAMLSVVIIAYIVIFGLSSEVLGVNKNRLLCGLTLIVASLVGCTLGKIQSYASRARIGLITAFILFLFALILSEVRTAILGLIAVSLVVFAYQSRKNSISLFLSIAVVLTFFILTGRLQQGWNDLLLWSNGNPNSSWGIRLELWQLALEGIVDKPLFGWGTKPYQALLDSGYSWSVPTFNPTHAHNDLLNVTLTNGLLGLAGWGCTVLLLIYRANGNTALLALLFSSLAMGFSERIWFDNKATLPLFISLWLLFSLPIFQTEEKWTRFK